ncbi:ferredoxin reductase family protein [Nocardioides daeguensis]|uniref:FAD-binding FR-type domain-containing protein n=1 Tax=Nocardioides daeguensis TaxID=908359 RepID=A0ABP6W5A0_9ACTN|nr:ferredoxin reductase family protein [Nocardioides daeguensis]MBV6727844.1 ferredoxin reductase family protein [Nocardioides daeguensis]MCR1775315.1 ferredoxin reductase family protein [Nocardioides daeguensis]
MQIRPPLAARDVGPVSIAGAVVACIALWVLARPASVPAGAYVGQLVGAVSILLLSVALVLISSLPWVEQWFDGIDRAAIWHRRLAITGLLLLAVHIPLSSSPIHSRWGGPLGTVGAIGMIALAVWAILPRWQSVVPGPLRGIVRGLKDAPVVRDVRRVFGGYDRWRQVHRLTGVFVAAGFVHGLLDGSPFPESGVLRWSYVAIGGIGLGFYLYRELLARFFRSLHDYEVDAVRAAGEGLVEIALRPLGKAMTFVPGQFALVYIEAKDGWHRHPFTIASAPHERLVRITVKALGDYTSSLEQLLEPGMPAVIGGPHGRFDHAKGTARQVWVAGGVGVAPFLSWMRALEANPPQGRVDLYYAFTGTPAPFADELVAIAAGQELVRVHLVDSASDGRLGTARIMADVEGAPAELSVFMCGPQAMLRDLQRGLRSSGVRARNIHREYFDWR